MNPSLILSRLKLVMDHTRTTRVMIGFDCRFDLIDWFILIGCSVSLLRVSFRHIGETHTGSLPNSNFSKV